MAYKVVWTTRANKQVLAQYKWLHKFWTQKEIPALSEEIIRTVSLIAKNPNLFKESELNGIRVAVVLKLNKLYYRVLSEEIRIIAFYPSRKKPLV
jgi:plasmid stabilization system protein ParE